MRVIGKKGRVWFEVGKRGKKKERHIVRGKREKQRQRKKEDK